MTAGNPAPVVDLVARLHAERDALAEQLANAEELIRVLIRSEVQQVRLSGASNPAGSAQEPAHQLMRPQLRLVAGGRR